MLNIQLRSDMSIVRIDASIQGPRSASKALADLVLEELQAARPHTSVVRRDLGAEPVPADAWSNATTASFTDADQRTPAQHQALSLAGTLAAELNDADVAVLALPLYNWGVSQHAKAWIDLTIAGAGPSTRLLEGTPTVLLTTRGGSYAPGSAREGWDHSTEYLRRILVDVWGADLTVVERELTLVGVNPAMDGYRDEAEVARREAEEAARIAGRRLGTRLAERLAA
jgi:FMN-dependent NADH-azoreductase